MSTLSGITGLEQRLSKTVELATELGERALAEEGAALLTDAHAAREAAPGSLLRTTVVRRMMEFERRALDRLARKLF